jgi:hypothetical protein
MTWLAGAPSPGVGTLHQQRWPACRTSPLSRAAGPGLRGIAGAPDPSSTERSATTATGPIELCRPVALPAEPPVAAAVGAECRRTYPRHPVDRQRRPADGVAGEQASPRRRPRRPAGGVEGQADASAAVDRRQARVVTAIPAQPRRASGRRYPRPPVDGCGDARLRRPRHRNRKTTCSGECTRASRRAGFRRERPGVARPARHSNGDPRPCVPGRAPDCPPRDALFRDEARVVC